MDFDRCHAPVSRYPRVARGLFIRLLPESPAPENLHTRLQPGPCAALQRDGEAGWVQGRRARTTLRGSPEPLRGHSRCSKRQPVGLRPRRRRYVSDWAEDFRHPESGRPRGGNLSDECRSWFLHDDAASYIEGPRNRRTRHDRITAGGFTQVPNVIQNDPNLELGEKAVYAHFLQYAWHHDYCFPSQDRIAKNLFTTVGSGDKIEGVILGVGGFLGVGEKKIGVRLGALRISKADGKIAITFPGATKEMLGAVDAYQRAGGAPPAKK